VKTYTELPQAESCRLIEFGRVVMLTLKTDPVQYFLVVFGMRFYLDMEVELVPLIYVDRPEWWGIEVVGRLREIGAPAIHSYVAAIPLAGVTGTQGVEVIGAPRTDKTVIQSHGLSKYY
jgi:hypothetical protein